ncbi:ketopantoate reductase family protein [Oceanobacillus sp. CAU 1775]
MKTLILGAGAMGCLFGAKLAQAGYDVTIYNRENEKVKTIEKDGIELHTTTDEIHTIPVEINYNAKELKPEYDLVLILLKSFATEHVLTEVKHLITENTVVLTLQNGVGNLENMQKVIPHAILGVGGTGSGASVLGLGKIAHRAVGKTTIGFLDKQHAITFDKIAKMFSNAGLATEIAEDVLSVIWSKLIVNVAINSLTGITKLTNGNAVLTNEGEAIARNLIREAVTVAKAEGIELLYDNPEREVIALIKEKFARNQSSMLTDVLQKRKTEIDVINGAIVIFGIKHNIETPYNELMVNLIHVIEKTYEQQIN